MLKKKSTPILYKALPVSILLVLIKIFILSRFESDGHGFNALIESSDINIVFTGAFFVIGMLLAGTMTDFKEGEKIPGEIASNLEAIQDWIMLAFSAPRSGTNDLSKEPLNKKYLKDTLCDVTDNIILWFSSKQKDSKVIFPELRKINGLAYYFAERGADKEAIKGIQENTNAMRKQLTRAYTIARNNFVAPAYTLLKSILTVISLLLLITKFKTPMADISITLCLSFVFFYMYHLITGLDDPFDIGAGDTEVDLKAIERFKIRLNDSFLSD